MVIALLWIGLICCGVANGLIYDHIEAPQSYYYMVMIGVVNVILLIYHRIYTRDWCKPKEKLKKNERRQEHFQVFGLSAMFSAAAFLSSVLTSQTGETSWGILHWKCNGDGVILYCNSKRIVLCLEFLAVHIGSLIFYDDLF